MSLGALGVTAYRDSFREPFHGAINQRVTHAPYPYCYRCPLGKERASCGLACLDYVRYLIESPATGTEGLGAVIIEPIQGRGGCVVPPAEWMSGLAELCRENDLVLILDEIYTGFGRTGKRFAMEHFGVEPDIVCLGKGMTGGFPMSAAVGTPRIMDAWGASAGESIHTSTFLGNPIACAGALAQLNEIEDAGLLARATQLGAAIVRQASEMGLEARGLGLIQGIASQRALEVASRCLQQGILLLAEGPRSNTIAITPAAVITEEQLSFALARISAILGTRGR
jgi:4-aminobutyrate aminotransferase-like enzyme